MSLIGEATVEIDLAEFWKFVAQHHPKLDEVMYGVPRINKSNGTLEIDVAFGYPSDCGVKSKAQKQWEEET